MCLNLALASLRTLSVEMVSKYLSTIIMLQMVNVGRKKLDMGSREIFKAI
jgi:hypothetical protein